jgi:hypothetical protein
MTRDQEGEPKIKLNRGMEFMLRTKKQRKKEGLFNFRIAKVVSFFSKEIHLMIELKITKKHSGGN